MKTFLIALFTLMLSCSAFAQPKVLSHRGFYKTNPAVDQNSLASLAAAQKLHKEMGLLACEFDVHKTADGELIIHHDHKINSKLHCQHSKWTDIQNFVLPNGSRIPTLREWFEQTKKTPDFTISLEMKTHETPAKETEVIADVIKLAKEMDMMKQLKFLSFSVHACKEVVRQAPEAYVIYNSSNIFETITPAKAKELGFSAISYKVDVFMNHIDWIAQAKKLGIETYLWMVEDEYLVDWATAHGIDWITTDYTDRILKYSQDLAKNKKKMKALKKSIL